MFPHDYSESFLNCSPDAVVILDGASKILWFNQKMKQDFPLIAATKPFALVVRNPSVKGALDRVLSGTDDSVSVAYEQRVPVERYTQVFLQKLHSEKHPETLISLTFRDLTEQRLTEKMHADFVANVSHELRTPLASIIGFVETLLGFAKDDKAVQEKFLNIMLTQGRRMAKLIQSLLSLSRIELHAHMPPTTSIDLTRVLSLVVDSAKSISRENHVELDASRLPTTSVWVTGDEDELIQVFQNILENAFKYTRPHTVVTLYPATIPAPVEGMIGITIQDQGEGIPADSLPRLTERFYRVDDARSRDKGGAGLGLSIVDHILSRHKGQLSIHSTMGEGSQFTVWLPKNGG